MNNSSGRLPGNSTTRVLAWRSLLVEAADPLSESTVSDIEALVAGTEQLSTSAEASLVWVLFYGNGLAALHNGFVELVHAPTSAGGINQAVLNLHAHQRQVLETDQRHRLEEGEPVLDEALAYEELRALTLLLVEVVGTQGSQIAEISRVLTAFLPSIFR